MEEHEITIKDLRNLKNKEEYEVWDERLGKWVDIAHSSYIHKGKNAGFSSPEDPFNQITSISMYFDWQDTLVTLAIPPKHLSDDDVTNIVQDIPNTIIFKSEIEMLETFFELIEDADILTGWNSEAYDIPYMVNRVTRIMSKDDTRKFCLMNQYPKQRVYEQFDKEEVTYDLVGRIHLDYLQLYKKYNYESRHSYSLDSIGEMEVNERKVKYEGSLDQLYNKEFKKFLEYNRQDTMLMVKIHNKLQFLDLANALAHENTVLLPTVMGSVAMIETAIMNEAHARGLIIPDKKRRDDNENDTAAGAYVASPKKGMHEYIGAIDINSLYPSTIRSLNIAPETLVAQIRPVLTDAYISAKVKEILSKIKRRKKEDAEDSAETRHELNSKIWEGVFAALEYDAVMRRDPGVMLILDYENGDSVEMSAAEIAKMVFDTGSPYILTANGTIFTAEKEGVIPGLLTRWYSDRKAMQKKMTESTTKEEKAYWDKRQLVRKILLNSAYGALLNIHCKFYDKRLGQSVTLSGRQIVKHMNSAVNETITGKYQHDGAAVIYSDTDSCYFTAYYELKPQIESGEIEWSKENCITIYDQITEQVNQSFPAFLEQAFHVPQRMAAIKAGRELIGDRGLFIIKKRYAINIFDKEGKRLDVNGRLGKIKVMGLDLKRSDTPKPIQEFLMQVLEMVLHGKDREDVVQAIRDYKIDLSKKPGWEKGTPKSVNKLTAYGQMEQNSRTGKATMPGHVRAALNYNYLRRVYGDNYSAKIVDGMKIVVCKLRQNPLGFTSVAYPTDELRLPEWFKEMPFDDIEMEKTLIDKKIKNLLGVLNWDIENSIDINTNFNDLFVFG